MAGQSISGVVGSIRWHDYTAAAINGYVVTPLSRDRQRWSLRATVVLSDSFKMAQRPLVFVAQLRNQCAWRWPVLSLTQEVERGVPTLVAELGPVMTDVAIQ